MSEVLHITERDELQDLLDTESRVVVKFTAPSWCAPCRQFAPVFEKVAENTSGTTFVAVDIDEADWAMVDYGFKSVPTVILFEGGHRSRDLKERTALKFINELS